MTSVVRSALHVWFGLTAGSVLLLALVVSVQSVVARARRRSGRASPAATGRSRRRVDAATRPPGRD